MKELELNNGQKVKLDTKLNIKKLMFINRDFNTDQFATLRGSEKAAEINIMSATQAVYIAYRQANMNDYIPYNEFLDLWDFDIEFATEIYAELLMGGAKKKPTANPYK